MANEFKVKKGLIVQGSGSVGDNTILDVQGNQGQLFSITDSLSGSLFSVGDISGIPILEVFSNEIVKIGTFGSEGLIVNGSNVTSSGNISSSGAITSLSGSIDHLLVNDKLQGNGAGFQFFAYNEDTSKVKFANWYTDVDNQYGMGMLWYETYFAAIDTDGDANDVNRRIGFYLEQPEAGATDSTSGQTGRHPNNARFYVDINGSYLSGSFTSSGNISASGTITADAITATLAAGTDNSVVVLNSSNQLVTDEINPLVFESDTIINSQGLTDGFIPVSDDGNQLDDSNLRWVSNKLGIGVGSVTPGEALEVVGNISSSGMGTFAQVRIGESTTTNYGLIVDYPDTRLLQLKRGGSVKFKVIADNADGQVDIYDNSGNSDIRFLADGDSYFTNNLGIGTTAPTEKLQVTGNISASGIILAGNGSSGAPSFAFGSNTNTGMFRPSPSQLGLVAGGVTNIQFGTNAVNIKHAGSTKLATTSTGVDITGDITATGTITAQEFHTEFVSASIIFSSGSTKFGDTLDDVHSMTGSLKITGSLQLGVGSISTGLSFGDGDTGIYEVSDDRLRVRLGGTDKFEFRGSTGTFGSPTSAGPQLTTGASSATVPGHNFTDDTNTGIGRAAADQLSLIAGGVEGIRVTTTGADFNSNITASGNISASGGIQTGFGSFSAAVDSITDAAIIIPENKAIYTKDSSGQYFRKLLRKATDVIEVGQSGTSLIDEIRFLPGNAGFTTFYGDTTEVARVDIAGNITASGNISGSSTSTLTIGGAAQAGSYKIAGATVLQGNANVTVGSSGATGTISLTTHTSTPFKIEGDDSITISSPISASGAISSSGLHVRNTGAAILTLHGDINNSGDSGEVDGIIDFLHDNPSNPQGFRINTENYAGKTALHFQEQVTGTFKNRLILHEDGGVGVGEGMDNPGTYAFAVSGSKMIIQDAGDVELILNADTDNVNENHDTNLTFKQDGTHNMLHIGSNGTAAGAQYNKLLDNSAFIIGGNGHSGTIKLQFGVNHTASMALTTTGLGIGTTGPGEKLTVHGNISASGHISGSSIVASNIGSSNALTTLKAINTNGVAEFGTQSGYSRIISQGTLRYATSPSIHFWYDSNGNTPMILADNGKLGLGTGTSPAEKLTVEGNISASGNLSLGNGGDGVSRLMVVDSDKQLTLEKSPGGYFTSFGYDSNQNYITYYSSPGMLIGYGATTGAAPTVNTLFLKTDGKVGIGTTSPTENLHVSESIRIGYPTGKLISKATDAFFGEITPFNVSGHMKLNVSYPGGNIVFQSGSTEVARFKDGKLGIGTSVPATTLHVSGSGAKFLMERSTNDAIIEVKTSTAGAYFFANSATTANFAGLQLQGAGSDSWFIGQYGYADFSITDGNRNTGTRHFTVQNTTGNVGIGTTSPSFKLDVEGDIGMNGKLYHNGDHNTYIGFEADNIKLRTGGTDRLEITNSGSTFAGNVTASGLLLDGNLIADDANLTSLKVAADTDALTILGRAKFSSYISDYMYLSHFDNGSSTSYAINQNAAGSTSINAVSGQNVSLKVNNSTKVILKGTTGKVGIGTTSPSEILTVAGNISASGTVKAGNIVAFNPGGTSKIAVGENDSYNFNHLIMESDGANNKSDFYTVGTGNNMEISTKDVADIILSSNKNIKFRTDNAGTLGGGTDRMFITGSSGNVGIGTTSPSEKLSVNGVVRVGSGGAWATSTGAVQLTYDSSTAQGVLSTYYDTTSLRLGAGTSQKTGITINGQNNANGNNITFRAGNSDRMFITGSTGNVGIGTTDPQYAKLQVNGTTLFQGASQIQGDLSLRGNVKDLNHNGTAFVTTKTRYTGGSELGLDYDFVRSINASNGGNIGIGTSTPTEALQVQGNISASGTGSLQYLMLGGATSLTEASTRLEVTGQINVGGHGSSGIVRAHKGKFGIINNRNTGTNIMTFDSGDGVSFTNHITASGNISASGTGTHTFGGNVKIDNPSTVGQLFIDSAASSDVVINLSNTDTQKAKIGWDHSESALAFVVGTGAFSTAGMVLDSTGVGIGTTSPAGTKLQVNSSTTDLVARFISSDNKAAIEVSDNDTTGYISAENDAVSIGSTLGAHANNLNIKSTNVGIGTTGPVEKLHIVGNISASGAIQLGATVPIKLLVNGGVPNDSTEFRNGGGEFKIYSGRTTNAQHQSFVFASGDNYTSGATRMVITGSNGNVGIGTTAPTEKLQVTGNISASGTVKSDDITIKGGVSTTSVSELGFTNAFDTAFLRSKYTDPSATTETYLAFHTNTAGDSNGTVSEKMRIAGPNVGIGTTAPTEKLTVTGNISASGKVDLSPGSSNTAGQGLTFRSRQDLGVYEYNYSLGIMAPNYVTVHIDSNDNNNDDTYFAVVKDHRTIASQTNVLFKVNESGTAEVSSHITASGNISASGNVDLGGGINFYSADASIKTEGPGAAGGHIRINPDGNLYLGNDATDQVQIGRTNNTAYTTVIYGGNGTSNIVAGLNYVKLNVPVTASGNISASGDGYFSNIYIPEGNKIIFDNETASDQFIRGSDSFITIEGDNNVNINADEAVTITTPSITASGNISASGDITAAKFGRDADNLIDFTTDNQIRFRVNGGDEANMTNGYFYPHANDGLGLGFGGKAWSDLFLASGAVINFNSDVTLTHSSNTLTLDGGTFGANTPFTSIATPEICDEDEETVIELANASATISGQTVINTRKFTKTSTTDGNYDGDVVFIGSTSTTKGNIYYFNSSGGWTIANADAEADASGLLAVALGTNSTTNGMLLRGMVTLVDIDGTEDEGKKLFLKATNGLTTTTAPSTSGHIVRILGYVLDNTNDQIWFNPDNTFVEVA